MKPKTRRRTRIAILLALAGAGMLWGCGGTGPAWPARHGNARNTRQVDHGPLERPEEVWRRDLVLSPRAAAVATTETVYVPNRLGVVALRVRDGGQVWNKEFGNSMVVHPAIVDQGLIIGRRDGKIQCLSFESGVEVWGTRIAWSPLGGILGDGDRSFVQSQEPKTPNAAETRSYGIDNETGSVKWEVRYGYGAPTVPAARGEFVYLTDRKQMQVRKRESGEEELTAEQGYVNWVGSPVVGETKVFYTGYTGRRVFLISQDAQIGGEEWRREFDSRYSSKGPALGEDKLYWVVPSQGLLAIDPATGRDLWTVPGEGETHVHPILTPEAVYWVMGKTLYAADPETGEGLWTYGLDTEPYYMLLAGKTLMLGLREGGFVALREP